jgi:hypothetical protein
MLTLKECKEKLKDDNRTYTDEEVLAIRDYLYKLASINVQYIKETLKENEQKSDSVYKSID